MLERRTMAVWLSVRFWASQHPLSAAACLDMPFEEALLGGPISAVTAKCPASSTASSLLSVLRGRAPESLTVSSHPP